jgi:hypothetical protein
MKFLIAFMLVAGVAITSLYAGPVPITPAQLGYQTPVVFGPSGQPEYLICPADVPDGCGGAFTENIGGINATVWCIDSQLNVSYGNTYSAYIEGLNGANGLFDANHVHYAGVTTFTGGAGGWSYDLAGYGVASPNSAQTRFELAAILISQYVPNDSVPTNSPQNQSIQDAIWRLTENNAAPSITDNIAVGTPSGSTDWIAYAASLLTTTPSSFFSQWAVVSGGWQPSTYFAGQQAYQTFLVQVTPEPRFYGLLLVALLSLCGIVYRRRMAS